MLRLFFLLFLASCLGCSAPSNETKSAEKTYVVEKNSDYYKVEMSEKVNKLVLELFSQEHLTKSIYVDGKSLDCEYVSDGSVARVVGCFPLDETHVEQVEILFENKKTVYLRQDVFIGNSCNNSGSLINVEKNYVQKNEFVFVSTPLAVSTFLWETEADKVSFLREIEDQL